MGHLISPVVFRLSKSNFWVSVWASVNKKNYKKYFLEDLNSLNFFKWVLNFVNYKKRGFKILDVNFIKFYKIYFFNFFIMFDEDFIIDFLKYKDIIYKTYNFSEFLFKLNCEKKINIIKCVHQKKLFDWSLNTKKKRFKKKKKSLKYLYDFTESVIFFKNFKNFNCFLNKKIKTFYFYYFLSKTSKKWLNLKKIFEKKKYIKKKIWEKNVRLSVHGIFKLSKFFNTRIRNQDWDEWFENNHKRYRWFRKVVWWNFQKKRKLKFKFLKLFKRRWNKKFELKFKFNKKVRIRKLEFKKILKKKKQIVKYLSFCNSKRFLFNFNLKNIFKLKRVFLKNVDKSCIPIKQILFIFKKFIEFYLKKTCKVNNLFINFFEKNTFRMSSRYIKRYIQLEIYKKGYRVSHLMHLIKKDLMSNVSILGFKIGYFGRYQKRLRNKDRYKKNGAMWPGTISSIVSYVNFSVLLKQGLAGIEISVVKKMKKNEIF